MHILRALIAACCLLPAVVWAQSDNVVLVLDASGSMWGRVGSETKIEAARKVVRSVIGKLPSDAALGLVAYGHRRKGDCADIEVLVPAGSADKTAIPDVVDGLNPLGMTPITASFEQAAKAAAATGKPGTIVLVTDGLETCNADPCAAVRAAKAAGQDFVLHIVGFDVAKEDVSSLECAAQAGGGLYLPAENADELSGALEQTIVEEQPEAAGEATLAVKSVVNGELHDAVVTVSHPGRRDVGGRTYDSPQTNPRTFPLPAGEYEVSVKPTRVQGAAAQRFDVTVEAGKLTEVVADFSTGELEVLVTNNGQPWDSTVNAVAEGETRSAAGGRTYDRAKTLVVPPGRYDVEIKPLRVENVPAKRFDGVEVRPSKKVERTFAFETGKVKILALAGGTPVDSTAAVRQAGKAVAGGRTYDRGVDLVLAPGSYEVLVKGLRVEGSPQKTATFQVQAGGDQTVEVELLN